MNKYLFYLSVSILALFGIVTFFLSTSILLDLFDIRAKEGNYVPFIVWANFICSILYLVSVYGFIKNESWTTTLLGASTLLLVVAFGGLLYYIRSGGIYEVKTVGAMIFRISVTLLFTALAYFTISKK